MGRFLGLVFWSFDGLSSETQVIIWRPEEPSLEIQMNFDALFTIKKMQSILSTEKQSELQILQNDPKTFLEANILFGY